VTSADLMPELLRGGSSCWHPSTDYPALRVPGAWHDLPVMPALVTWQIERADSGKVVVRSHTAYDVRDRLPDPTAFWQVYARGTHQNMSVFGKHYSYMQPGVYLLRLAPAASTPAGSATRSTTSSSPRRTSAATAARACSGSACTTSRACVVSDGMCRAVEG
jgi:hypothetical protein